MFGVTKPKTPAAPDPALPAIWPEPPFGRSGPRVARLTDGTKASVLMLRGVSICVIAIGLPIVITRADTFDQLAKHGKVVQATVEEVREAKKGGGEHEVHLGYEMSGQRFSFRQALKASRYSRINVGDTFPVTALPWDPAVHRFGHVTNKDVTDVHLEGSALVACLALGFAVASLVLLTCARQQRKTLESWPAATAQTLSVETESAGKSGTRYKIRFRKLGSDGQVREDKYELTRSGDFSLSPGEFFTFFTDPVFPKIIQPMFTINLAEMGKPIDDSRIGTS